MDIAFGSPLSGFLVLGAALALGVGGLVLIWYSARMTREAVGRRVDLVRNKASAMRMRAMTPEMSFIRETGHGMPAPERHAAMRLFGRIGVPPSRAIQALQISQFGAMLAVAVAAYFGTGMVQALAASTRVHILLAVGLGIAGWLIPMMLVRRQIKHRAKAVVAGLPDALELLVICVEAGVAFEDGIDRVVVELQASQPALSDELALTSADLKILPSRDRALANLAERVPMPSVRSVVTTLSQTMRYGTPLAQALRIVAAELRTDSLVRLEERANQLPTLMTVPMMIFIMPTIFMVVGGPAVLRLLDNFHH